MVWSEENQKEGKKTREKIYEHCMLRTLCLGIAWRTTDRFCWVQRTEVREYPCCNDDDAAGMASWRVTLRSGHLTTRMERNLISRDENWDERVVYYVYLYVTPTCLILWITPLAVRRTVRNCIAKGVQVYAGDRRREPGGRDEEAARKTSEEKEREI